MKMTMNEPLTARERITQLTRQFEAKRLTEAVRGFTRSIEIMKRFEEPAQPETTREEPAAPAAPDAADIKRLAMERATKTGAPYAVALDAVCRELRAHHRASMAPQPAPGSALTELNRLATERAVKTGETSAVALAEVYRTRPDLAARYKAERRRNINYIEE